MEYLLLILAFPLIWPFIAKKIWPHEITWSEIGINIVGVAVLVTGVWFLGKYGATADTEIWNGKIISKHRDHEYWLETYQCNCTEHCSGTGKNRSCYTTCQTCYRDHYTVDWYAMSDFGGAPYKIRLKYLDRESKSVYRTPDPAIYTNCKPGEPASIEQTYTNYVQAVPDSLFNTKMDDQVYADKIPEYPRVYGKYKINRVLNMGSTVPSHMLTDLNNRLNDALRELGPKKEANVIVIVTDITDPSYRHVVENAWIGGKKNDVVVFLGTNGTEMVWSDVMTFAHNIGNERLHVTLRNALSIIVEFDSVVISDLIERVIDDRFDRISMEEFAYLEDEIQPANWVIIMAVILAIGGSIGVSFIMRVVDIGGNGGYTRSRRRRLRF